MALTKPVIDALINRRKQLLRQLAGVRAGRFDPTAIAHEMREISIKLEGVNFEDNDTTKRVN